MLSQELHEELQTAVNENNLQVTSHYLFLLGKYKEISISLFDSAQELTEKGFIKAVTNQGVCHHLANKKMLMIQNRLLEYVLDYYDAASKAGQIRDADFSSAADVRFDLLTTRAIRSKSQYKTVARALSKKEYQNLLNGIGLAEFDWGQDGLF
jgi:hypothetical protein